MMKSKKHEIRQPLANINAIISYLLLKAKMNDSVDSELIKEKSKLIFKNIENLNLLLDEDEED